MQAEFLDEGGTAIASFAWQTFYVVNDFLAEV
jgi:hypothetical protein